MAVSQQPLFVVPEHMTHPVYFSLLTHTNQLLLVTLCHTPAGIGNSKVGRDADADGRRRRKDRQT